MLVPVLRFEEDAIASETEDAVVAACALRLSYMLFHALDQAASSPAGGGGAPQSATLGRLRSEFVTAMQCLRLLLLILGGVIPMYGGVIIVVFRRVVRLLWYLGFSRRGDKVGLSGYLHEFTVDLNELAASVALRSSDRALIVFWWRFSYLRFS